MNFSKIICFLFPRLAKDRRRTASQPYIGVDRRCCNKMSKAEMQREVNEKFDHLSTLIKHPVERK